MAPPTRWTWVWVNSGSWWWTGRPGVQQSMGSQVGCDWATKLNWFSMKWWNQMPWSSFFECWVLSQLFHSPLSPSSRGCLIPFHFLPLGWCHLHSWGYWSCLTVIQYFIIFNSSTIPQTLNSDLQECFTSMNTRKSSLHIYVWGYLEFSIISHFAFICSISFGNRRPVPVECSQWPVHWPGFPSRRQCQGHDRFRDRGLRGGKELSPEGRASLPAALSAPSISKWGTVHPILYWLSYC